MTNGATCPTWANWQGLAVAVLARAVRDARGGRHPSAVAWLYSPDCCLWFDVIGLDASDVGRLLER